MFHPLTNADGTQFKVHLTPRASKAGIGGRHGDALKVKVTAPPIDNQANEALVKLLAKNLKVRRGAVRIISGRTSRMKIIQVEGLTPREVNARLVRE